MDKEKEKHSEPSKAMRHRNRWYLHRCLWEVLALHRGPGERPRRLSFAHLLVSDDEPSIPPKRQLTDQPGRVTKGRTGGRSGFGSTMVQYNIQDDLSEVGGLNKEMRERNVQVSSPYEKVVPKHEKQQKAGN